MSTRARIEVFILLATLFSFVYTQNSILLNVYYPEEHVCRNCSLLFGTSLDNFLIYGNDSNPLPSSRLQYQGGNLYTATVNLDSSVPIGSPVSITLLYSLDVRAPFNIVDPIEALKELMKIELYCFNLVLGVKARALGQQTNITIHEGQNIVTVYPYFCTQEGKLDANFRFYSPEFNDTRQVYALVPPSLIENPISRYVNVLVLNDGQFANWIAQDVFQLINNGEIAETLIIGVSSNYQRNYELTPTKCNNQCEDCAAFGRSGGGPLYVDFCADTVIPQILAKFNLHARAENISMGGYSLGGLMGCWAPYLRPDTFTKSYCGSPSLSWNCEEFSKQLVPSTTETPLAVYIDYGTAEGEIQSIPATDAFNALTQQSMVPNSNLWLYASYGDLHDTNSWKRRFWRVATDLLRYPASN